MECTSENRNISPLFSFNTDYGADSVEWCPHSPNQNLFVCANYELIENGCEFKKRVGKILLFSITPENGLKLHQTVDTAAVLDQKWCPNKINNTILLSIVNASKKVEVYRLKEDPIQIELVSFFEIPNNETEILVLSLDWSTGLYQSEEPEIICSDSKGNIHLLKLVNNNLILQNSWHGHEFEAWIAGFYYWDTNIFFSGGDDSVLLKFDKRIGNQAIAKNKSHQAGVTSLHSNRSKENILVTGSYDENIRLWDIRNMKSEVSFTKMPGTLWRLKWDPFCQDYLLAACMLGGIHVLDVKNIEEMKIFGSFYGHKSICYGVDWCYLKSENCKKIVPEANSIVVTCSFYDHLLYVSKFYVDPN